MDKGVGTWIAMESNSITLLCCTDQTVS